MTEHSTRATWERDLAGHVDRFGHIAVAVEIGGGPGTAEDKRGTGASASPRMIARFLRDLADDVERVCAKKPDPKKSVCEGFHWIGQSFATCDNCGRPAWEHKGMCEPGEPFGGEHERIREWKPGEADAIRAKWAAPETPEASDG